MAIIHPSVRLTYEDYLDFPDDGKRYEILEGELAVTPSPNVSHQTIQLNLGVILNPHVRANKLGKLLIAPCDVLLSETSIVQPDLLFVSRERLSIVEERFVNGAPDLVVEILSPSTAHRDRGAKRKLYTQFGVPYYWQLEPVNREIVVLRLDDGEYRQIAIGRGDEEFVAPPFLDLVIPLSEVWE